MNKVVPKTMLMVENIVLQEGTHLEATSFCPHCGTKIFVISNFSMKYIIEEMGDLIQKHLESYHPSLATEKGLEGWSTDIIHTKTPKHPEPSYMN